MQRRNTGENDHEEDEESPSDTDSEEESEDDGVESNQPQQIIIPAASAQNVRRWMDNPSNIHGQDPVAEDEDVDLIASRLAEVPPLQGAPAAKHNEETDQTTGLVDPDAGADSESVAFAASYIGGSTTTQATIAPEVIRERVKKEHAKRQRHDKRKEAKPKGDAGAALRQRRTNRDIVKEYAGWDEF